MSCLRHKHLHRLAEQVTADLAAVMHATVYSMAAAWRLQQTQQHSNLSWGVQQPVQLTAQPPAPTWAVRPTPPQKRRKGMARLWSMTSSRYRLALPSSMPFSALAASREFLKCTRRSLPLACASSNSANQQTFERERDVHSAASATPHAAAALCAGGMQQLSCSGRRARDTVCCWRQA
jgi:hypothetical protein